MAQRILFTCVAIAVASQALSHDVLPIFEQNNLANTILKSGRSMGDHPERSVNCFLIYLPQLNAVTEEYERQYNRCIDISANSQARMEKEVAEDRQNVNAFANAICQGYANCSQISSSADYFDCYNKAAGETIATSYNIQTISKDKMQYIAFRTQMIKFDQDTCTEKCKGEYVEDTAKLYAALDVCLESGEYVPGPTTTVW